MSRILIMDDDEQDLKAMGIVLQKAGFQDVLFASSAEEGLRWVDVYHPEMILIDVVLRNIDGFDVCKTIRSDRECKSRIVMVTGHLEAVDVQKARTSGADEIVEKRPGFERLVETVRSLS